MEKMEDDFEMVATTFFGLEEVLVAELTKLGARDVTKLTRAVSFKGDLGFLYKANFCLRTALKILKPIATFSAANEQELYEGIKAIDWTAYLEKDGTLAVDSTLNSDFFNHTHYVSQKTKDAIVDQFREQFNERPSVNIDSPDIKLHVHIFREKVTVSLDSSGPILFKRGYRDETSTAPLNEVLAAGLVMLTGWDKRIFFMDPMCGSGTIPTEAALYANNVPAGYFREKFGFMTWKNYDKELWNTICESSISKITNHEQKILGIEISYNTAKIAKENVTQAQVEDIVSITKGSFFDYKPTTETGVIVMNPPYGNRIGGSEDDINTLYKEIGNKLKRDFSGFTAWILTSNPEAAKNIGLRPTRKITLFNGPLECRFLRFDLYAGTKKIHKLRDKEENSV